LWLRKTPSRTAVTGHLRLPTELYAGIVPAQIVGREVPVYIQPCSRSFQALSAWPAADISLYEVLMSHRRSRNGSMLIATSAPTVRKFCRYGTLSSHRGGAIPVHHWPCFTAHGPRTISHSDTKSIPARSGRHFLRRRRCHHEGATGSISDDLAAEM
jgi:hypothetical protein